ncbi:hypothetical protein [Streptomyces chrestomyceticus]|uniref:hypothetical protein n=1 Tax=Streptomyces chrestomyceticus TaxID=68185 RepID=UPI0033E8F0BB
MAKKRKKNALDRLTRGMDRMDKDARKGIHTALGTKKRKKKKGAKARAKQNQRHLAALTEHMGRLTEQVSALTSTVADDRKGSAAGR